MKGSMKTSPSLPKDWRESRRLRAWGLRKTPLTLLHRDLEQACTYLETAIQASVALGSQRRLKESFTLFQQMQQTWQKESSLMKLQLLFSQHLVKNA